jgi:hypothetical protein
MSGSVIAVFIVIAALVAMIGLALVGRRIRHSGKAGAAIGAAMAAYDEAMHSTAHDTFVEVEAAKNRPASLHSPDTP